MYLAKLDEENKVVEVLSSTTFPILVRLDESWMLTYHPATVGHTFDPETRMFTAPPPPRHITRLAFLSRFTMEENVGIELASIHDPASSQNIQIRAATLRKMLQLVNAANWIDLDRPDTRALVMQIEQMGLLAEGRALEILDGIILDVERPSADMPKAVEA